MSARARREVTKRFKNVGLSLRKDALNRLLEFTSNIETDELPAIIDGLAKLAVSQSIQSGCVSLETLQPLLEQYTVETADPVLDNLIQIIDSFELPSFRYKKIRKIFVRIPPQSTHGTAEDAATMFCDRYEILCQRIQRGAEFGQSTFRTKQQVRKLTTTTELRGTTRSRHVFGMLCELEEGKICLQDLDGHVEVDLSQAERGVGLFTWNCFVVATGCMNDYGVFEIEAMSQPGFETRRETLTAYPSLDFVPFEKRQQIEQAEQSSDEDSFVFLSNVYLDDTRIWESLEKLFVGFSQVEILPTLFVFMGNFTREKLGANPRDMKKLRGYFNRLCEFILKYPALVEECEFAFIPGPHDPSTGNVLPRPGLFGSVAGKLKDRLHARFPSNPCRLRFGTQEIVVCREDLLAKMRRNCVVLPSTDEVRDLTQHLVHTVLEQAHLCPLPIPCQPIAWNFDHALRLYPVPNVLIMADSQESFRYTYGDCLIVNPGEFSHNGSFVSFSPCSTDKVQFQHVV